MSYPAVFTHKSIRLDRLPESISQVGQIECYYRLGIGPKPEISLDSPVLKQLDTACSAAKGLPSAEALQPLVEAPQGTESANDRADLFGMLIEAIHEAKDYAQTVATFEQRIGQSPQIISLRTEYYCILSLIALNRLDDAIALGVRCAETYPAERHLFLHQCGLAARASKQFDRAATFLLDSFVAGNYFSPPLVALAFLANRMTPKTVEDIYDRLTTLHSEAPGSRGELSNALSCLAARIGHTEESFAHNRDAVDARSARKVSKQQGRILEDPITEPDFIILGMPKCGTTSAYSQICKHPHVLGAARKEIHFFTRKYDSGFDWYLSHFVNAELASGRRFVTGEASPGYFSNEDALTRVVQHCTATKFFVFLRNPAARLISGYYQRKKMAGLDVPIVEFFEQQFERDAAGGSPFLQGSIYLTRLKTWENAVGRDRLHVVNADELFQTPEPVMADIFSFLGLDPTLSTEEFPKVNVGSYPKAPPALLDRLATYYFDHNRKLFDYLGRDMGWNSQRLY